MKKEGKLTTLKLIKSKKFNLFTTLKKERKKSSIGTNDFNLYGSKPVLLNQIEGEDLDNIDAYKGNGHSGQNTNHYQQPNKSGGPVKCTYCCLVTSPYRCHKSDFRKHFPNKKFPVSKISSLQRRTQKVIKRRHLKIQEKLSWQIH